MKELFELLPVWLPTWVAVLFLLVYTLYTFFRAYAYFDNGVKETMLGYGNREVRFYHIVWIVVDIPSLIMGRLYHVLKWAFAFKVYTFKDKTSKEEAS